MNSPIESSCSSSKSVVRARSTYLLFCRVTSTAANPLTGENSVTIVGIMTLSNALKRSNYYLINALVRPSTGISHVSKYSIINDPFYISYLNYILYIYLRVIA